MRGAGGDPLGNVDVLDRLDHLDSPGGKRRLMAPTGQEHQGDQDDQDFRLEAVDRDAPLEFPRGDWPAGVPTK